MQMEEQLKEYKMKIDGSWNWRQNKIMAVHHFINYDLTYLWSFL